jgi:hypothetical protein
MLTCAGCGQYIAGEYWHEGCATPPSEEATDRELAYSHGYGDGLAAATGLDGYDLADAFTWFHVRTTGGCSESHRSDAAEYARLTASDGDREP